MKIDANLKVMACKHASSKSCIQKMADIGRQFAVIKSESKKVTAINIPSGYRLTGKLEYEIDCLYASGTLILNLPARKAIIEHIVSFPEIYDKTMQPKTTKKGYVENGMEDEEMHTYLDVHKMLKTCMFTRFQARL